MRSRVAGNRWLRAISTPRYSYGSARKAWPRPRRRSHTRRPTTLRCLASGRTLSIAGSFRCLSASKGVPRSLHRRACGARQTPERALTWGRRWCSTLAGSPRCPSLHATPTTCRSITSCRGLAPVTSPVTIGSLRRVCPPTRPSCRRATSRSARRMRSSISRQGDTISSPSSARDWVGTSSRSSSTAPRPASGRQWTWSARRRCSRCRAT